MNFKIRFAGSFGVASVFSCSALRSSVFPIVYSYEPTATSFFSYKPIKIHSRACAEPIKYRKA